MKNLVKILFITTYAINIFSCDDSDPVGVQCDEGLTEINGQCFDNCNVLNGDGSSCSCDDVVCNPSSSCVTSSCFEGSCIESSMVNGSVCDDGDACTSGDVCSEGSCVSGSLIINCP